MVWGRNGLWAVEGRKRWSQRKMSKSGVHRDRHNENTFKANGWENERGSFLQSVGPKV